MTILIMFQTSKFRNFKNFYTGFFGLKLHLVINAPEELIAFKITRATHHDSTRADAHPVLALDNDALCFEKKSNIFRSQ